MSDPIYVNQSISPQIDLHVVAGCTNHDGLNVQLLDAVQLREQRGIENVNSAHDTALLSPEVNW